jgi:K+ transporter
LFIALFQVLDEHLVLGRLALAEILGMALDPSQLSFFVGRVNVKPSSRPGMARWREHL